MSFRKVAPVKNSRKHREPVAEQRKPAPKKSAPKRRPVGGKD
ncbi:MULTISPECIES: hypothetical protein [unclassified Streptomyces]